MAKLLYTLLIVVAYVLALCSGSYINAAQERSSKTDMEPFTKFMECMNQGSRDDGDFDFQSWMQKLSTCAGMSSTTSDSS